MTQCHFSEVMKTQYTVHRHVQRPTTDSPQKKEKEKLVAETQIRHIKMYLYHQHNLETAKFKI